MKKIILQVLFLFFYACGEDAGSMYFMKGNLYLGTSVYPINLEKSFSGEMVNGTNAVVLPGVPFCWATNSPGYSSFNGFATEVIADPSILESADFYSSDKKILIIGFQSTNGMAPGTIVLDGNDNKLDFGIANFQGTDDVILLSGWYFSVGSVVFHEAGAKGGVISGEIDVTKTNQSGSSVRLQLEFNIKWLDSNVMP